MKCVPPCREEMRHPSAGRLPGIETSAVVTADRETAPTSARSSLQFGDGDNQHPTTQAVLNSSDVLELLKEESDLLEDEEDPMSFMKPTLTTMSACWQHCFWLHCSCVSAWLLKPSPTFASA